MKLNDDMKSNNDYKHIVDETFKKSNKLNQIISVILFVAVIVYMLLPINVGGGIFGRVEDFFFFMASFSNMYANFIGVEKIRASLLLKLVALVFCVLGAISLFLIVFFS